MKYRVILIGATSIISISILIILFWFSGPFRNIKNGFNRTLIEQAPLLVKKINLKSDLNYFAGWIDEKCYLANPYLPLEVLEIDDTVQTIIRISKWKSEKVKVGKLSIDSPYFYLADLNSYSIHRGNVLDWRIDTTILHRKFFSESLPITASSTILRTLNKERSMYMLSKVGVNKTIVESSDLIQKQIDGLFCTDGVLLFDKGYDRILYTYYYRNQFICSDTSLNLLYRGRTIDTTSTAKIKVAKIESMGVSTLASPPALVNRSVFVNNGMLFINSNLSGDSERPDVFRMHDAIDIYDTSSGEYRISFYIPRQHDQRLRTFAVRSDELMVLRGARLEVYRLHIY